MPNLGSILNLIANQLGSNDFKLVGYEVLAGGASESQVAIANVEVERPPLSLTGQRRNNLTFDLVCQLVPSPLAGLTHEKRAAVIARSLTITIMNMRVHPEIKDSHITAQSYSTQTRELVVSAMVVFYDDMQDIA